MSSRMCSLLTDSNKILIKYDRRDCKKFIKYISFKAVKYSCYILIGSVAYKKKIINFITFNYDWTVRKNVSSLR